MPLCGDFHCRQDDEPPYHGGRVIHRTAGLRRPYSGLCQKGRDMSWRGQDDVQYGLQEASRHRRFYRCQGLRLHHPDRPALYSRQESDCPLQVPQSAAHRQGKGRRGIRRLLRSRAPLPHEVCGSGGQSTGQGRVCQEDQDSADHEGILQLLRLSGGGDSHSPAHTRRCQCPSVHHASQCPGHSSLSANSQRTLS